MRSTNDMRETQRRPGPFILPGLAVLLLGGLALAIGVEGSMPKLMAPPPGHAFERPRAAAAAAMARLGFTAEPVTPATAIRLGLPPSQQGLVITSLSPTGPACAAGARVGDVLVQLDDARVTGLSALGVERSGAPVPPKMLHVDRIGGSRLIWMYVAPSVPEHPG